MENRGNGSAYDTAEVASDVLEEVALLYSIRNPNSSRAAAFEAGSIASELVFFARDGGGLTAEELYGKLMSVLSEFYREGNWYDG